MKTIVQWILSVAIMLDVTSALAQVANPDLTGQAKKEGREGWYTTVSIPESKQFVDMFEKQYPFLKVDLLRSGSGALVNRIVSEYAATNYSVDVMQGTSSRGGFTALKQRNIIGRYESPEHKFLAPELKDKNGYWASSFLNSFVLAYNKRNVKPDDVPKTYELAQADLERAADHQRHGKLRVVRRPAQILGPGQRAGLFSPAGPAGPDLPARRARAHPTRRCRRSAADDRLRTARPELRQSRRAHRVGATRAGGGDRQHDEYRAKTAASSGGKTVYRFFVFENLAIEAARNEPHPGAQRR